MRPRTSIFFLFTSLLLILLLIIQKPSSLIISIAVALISIACAVTSGWAFFHGWERSIFSFEEGRKYEVMSFYIDEKFPATLYIWLRDDTRIFPAYVDLEFSSLKVEVGDYIHWDYIGNSEKILFKSSSPVFKS